MRAGLAAVVTVLFIGWVLYEHAEYEGSERRRQVALAFVVSAVFAAVLLGFVALWSWAL